jgi:hypothetical protein
MTYDPNYDGVREVIALFVQIIREYTENRAAVSAVFPAEVVAGLDALALFIGTISALNAPGPN